MKRNLLSLFSLLILALGLVACSQPGKTATIEGFYSDEAHKAILDAQLEELRNQYVDAYSIEYSISENTFTYRYTYKQPCSNAEATKTSIETNLTSEFANPVIDSLEQDTGIVGVSVQYIYCDSDGTELFNKTFSK